ncbi:MAG TPA: transketolase [Candidatus Paceibacterota bacterium]
MESLTPEKIKFLEETANNIRESIIEMLLEAKSGHTAGPLGMADVFTALFFHILKHDSKNPAWPERDRLVLSNGHICPVYYATLAHAGYIPLDELKTLRKFGSRLQGHPHREYLPLLETSSGPLGAGLAQAVGMALVDRMDNGKSSGKQIYALLSDGEHDEGATWEAYLLAGKEKLQNLTVVIDRNNIQIDGFTEDIMPLEPFGDKLRAFGFHVQSVDGHNFESIVEAVGIAQAEFSKPSAIIMNTIPGKGVKEFERKYEWHGKPPNKEEADMALRELRTLGGKIRSEHE